MEGEGEHHLRITCIEGLPLSVATENGGYKMEFLFQKLQLPHARSTMHCTPSLVLAETREGTNLSLYNQ